MCAREKTRGNRAACKPSRREREMFLLLSNTYLPTVFAGFENEEDKFDDVQTAMEMCWKHGAAGITSTSDGRWQLRSCFFPRQSFAKEVSWICLKTFDRKETKNMKRHYRNWHGMLQEQL